VRGSEELDSDENPEPGNEFNNSSQVVQRSSSNESSEQPNDRNRSTAQGGQPNSPTDPTSNDASVRSRSEYLNEDNLEDKW